MPRNNKNNAKARVVKKTQQEQPKPMKPQKEKRADFDDNIKYWDSSKDEVPTTSTKVVAKTLKKTKNLEASVQATASSSSVNLNKKTEKERQLPVTTKRKRKPINRLICFSDSDDDEPIVGPPTMRYVDVARGAMFGVVKPVPTHKTTTQLIDMGLEEFPLLQPSKLSSSEVYNRNSEAHDSDSSVPVSFVRSKETDLSDMTKCLLIDDNEQMQMFDEMERIDDENQDEDDEEEEDEDGDENENDEGNNTAIDPGYEDPCLDSNNDICCGAENGSSSGSYWAEGSNETGSEMEIFSCTDDGGGDASYALNSENECPPQPPEPPTTSTFSQEWLDTTVRSLALPFGVSIPSFNFIQPDINFSRFERQFDDAHYKRMEDRAMFSLRLALNKSFFGEGNYM